MPTRSSVLSQKMLRLAQHDERLANGHPELVEGLLQQKNQLKFRSKMECNILEITLSHL